MSLLEKLKKNSTIKEASILSESDIYIKDDLVRTDVASLNIALSGEVDGGLSPGLTVIAGPSKHFKSNMSLIMVKAYLDLHDDAICLFYDNEFGISEDYIATIGIDPDRVLHTPVANVEELKFDIVQQLDGLEKNDKVIILLDSLGNIASKKELDDAKDAKSVADMSRAKAIKSLFRIVTPYLNRLKIPFLAVNHVYSETGMFAKTVVSGGTGLYYSANAIFIIGRQQEKEGTEVVGYNFIINIEKSRYVREKSKIPLSVTFESGIDAYSGLFDLAVDSGLIVKPKNGWYQMMNLETGEFPEKNIRRKEVEASTEWFDELVKNVDFQETVKRKYKLSRD
jgi:RecA/RadA recombinase